MGLKIILVVTPYNNVAWVNVLMYLVSKGATGSQVIETACPILKA